VSSFVFTAPAPVFLSQNRLFEFEKSGQLFIGTHNEALPVGAMRICNPDRCPLKSTPETKPPKDRKSTKSEDPPLRSLLWRQHGPDQTSCHYRLSTDQLIRGELS
jgi:hypothetical protein